MRPRNIGERENLEQAGRDGRFVLLFLGWLGGLFLGGAALDRLVGAGGWLWFGLSLGLPFVIFLGAVIRAAWHDYSEWRRYR